jgi:hypothetical protein
LQGGGGNRKVAASWYGDPRGITGIREEIFHDPSPTKARRRGCNPEIHRGEVLSVSQLIYETESMNHNNCILTPKVQGVSILFPKCPKMLHHQTEGTLLAAM